MEDIYIYIYTLNVRLCTDEPLYNQMFAQPVYTVASPQVQTNGNDAAGR